MEYRKFGSTGIDVSVIGFGCWEIGGTYGDVKEDDFRKAVLRALDLGINCFDTAPVYGLGPGGSGRGASERILGSAIGKRRKETVLVTKCGVGYSGRPRGRDSRRDAIITSIDQSLQNLGTDYLDVLLIHWPDFATPIAETMEALDTAVESGKVLHVGVSNYSLAQIKEAMGTGHVDVAQYGLHMFDRRMEADIFPYCKNNGIGVMTYGSLAFGLLAGAFNRNSVFTKNDWRAGTFLPTLFLSLFEPHAFNRNLEVVEDLKVLAAQQDRRIPHLALRWVLSNPAVSTALVGIRNITEVDDNMGTLGWSLTEEDHHNIDSIFRKHGVETEPAYWIEAEPAPEELNPSSTQSEPELTRDGQAQQASTN